MKWARVSSSQAAEGPFDAHGLASQKDWMPTWGFGFFTGHVSQPGTWVYLALYPTSTQQLSIPNRLVRCRHLPVRETVQD